MARHVIAPVAELPPGPRQFLTIEERPIAVFNIKGACVGRVNPCPPQGRALCGGPVRGSGLQSGVAPFRNTPLACLA